MTYSREATLSAAVVAAILLLASWLVLTTAYSRQGCSSGACTLYDHGRALPGRCGEVKGDKSRCYCIQITQGHSATQSVNPAPPQPQVTCSAR